MVSNILLLAISILLLVHLGRAGRMARRTDADLYAVHLDLDARGDEQEEKGLAANLQFAEVRVRTRFA